MGGVFGTLFGGCLALILEGDKIANTPWSAEVCNENFSKNKEDYLQYGLLNTNEGQLPQSSQQGPLQPASVDVLLILPRLRGDKDCTIFVYSMFHDFG